MKKKIIVPIMIMTTSLIMLSSNNTEATCTAAAACNGDSLYCMGDFECSGIPNVSVTCDGVLEECESPRIQ